MKNNDARLTQATNFYNAARLANNFALLQQAGFTEAALEEGGELIGRAVRLARLGAFPTEVDTSLLVSIEAYQSRWFPAVRATLDRYYPDVSKLFFTKMVQLEGKQAPLSLLEFLETLGRLSKGEPPFGEQGPEVRALISERMLTEEVEAEGHALLGEWNQVAKENVTALVAKEEIEAAITAAWKWRVEWADHARAVIKSRGLLRGLGIRSTKRAARPEATPALPPSAEGTTPAALPVSTNALAVVEAAKAS